MIGEKHVKLKLQKGMGILCNRIGLDQSQNE